jgi:hypothetical protein
MIFLIDIKRGVRVPANRDIQSDFVRIASSLRADMIFEKKPARRRVPLVRAR